MAKQKTAFLFLQMAGGRDHHDHHGMTIASCISRKQPRSDLDGRRTIIEEIPFPDR